MFLYFSLLFDLFVIVLDDQLLVQTLTSLQAFGHKIMQDFQSGLQEKYALSIWFTL